MRSRCDRHAVPGHRGSAEPADRVPDAVIAGERGACRAGGDAERVASGENRERHHLPGASAAVDRATERGCGCPAPPQGCVEKRGSPVVQDARHAGRRDTVTASAREPAAAAWPCPWSSRPHDAAGTPDADHLVEQPPRGPRRRTTRSPARPAGVIAARTRAVGGGRSSRTRLPATCQGPTALFGDRPVAACQMDHVPALDRRILKPLWLLPDDGTATGCRRPAARRSPTLGTCRTVAVARGGAVVRGAYRRGGE